MSSGEFQPKILSPQELQSLFNLPSALPVTSYVSYGHQHRADQEASNVSIADILSGEEIANLRSINLELPPEINKRLHTLLDSDPEQGENVIFDSIIKRNIKAIEDEFLGEELREGLTVTHLLMREIKDFEEVPSSEVFSKGIAFQIHEQEQIENEFSAWKIHEMRRVAKSNKKKARAKTIS